MAVRFGIRGVMMLTMAVGVGMAAAYQFYRASQTGERIYLFIGMLVLCVAPMGLWIVASLVTRKR